MASPPCRMWVAVRRTKEAPSTPRKDAQIEGATSIVGKKSF